MDGTFFLASDIVADGNYALGETSGQGIDDPVLADTYENAWGRPAGYATSNVYDMAKFVGFLRDGNTSVMPDDLRQSMMTAHIDTVSYGDLIDYGYGLSIDKGFFHRRKRLSRDSRRSSMAATFPGSRPTGIGFPASTSDWWCWPMQTAPISRACSTLH